MKSASQTDVFPGNNLINMYSKFGSLEDAQAVFDDMPMRNTITWTSLIGGYALVEDLSSVLRHSRLMHQLGERFNGHTCAIVLQACRSPDDCIIGKQVHGLCVRTGDEKNVVVGTSLASMYLRCGRPDDAERVLDAVIDVDVRCLNLLISEYGKMGDETRALRAFCDLRYYYDLEPDEYTFTNIISSCDGGGADLGRQLHGLAVRCGAVWDLSVGNAIVTMYGKHGLSEDAERMFQGMRRTNLVSWTALMSSLVKNGLHLRAAHRFVELLESSLPLDSSCLATAVDACAHLRDMALVNRIHGVLLKLGFLSDAYVPTALVDAYAKCGNMKAAWQVFKNLARPNAAVCNAILRGGPDEEDPLALFNWMRHNGIQPDWITCTRLLSSVADQASMARGTSLHGYAVKSGLEGDINVGNSLISMYAKCGSMEDALQKFGDMASHDCVSWNSLISGLAAHGRGKEAVLLVEKMEVEGLKPDETTLVAALQSCSYSGLFRTGLSIYHDMERKYGIKPSLDHQVCMVDLLGRSGDTSGAMELVEHGGFGDSPLLWRTLVNVCKLNGDTNLGMLAAERLIRLAPDDPGSCVLVCNLYAEAGMLEKAAKFRVLLRNRGMRKEAGHSWIEIDREVHKFIANGSNHEESVEIQDVLDRLSNQMKETDIIQQSTLGSHMSGALDSCDHVSYDIM